MGLTLGSLVVVWLVIACFAWRSASAAERFALPMRRRLRAAQRLRTCNSSLLLVQYAMLAVAIYGFDQSGAWALTLSELAILLCMVAVNMLLVVVTWRMPMLPGRSILRRGENLLVVLAGVLLLVVAAMALLGDTNARLFGGYIALAGLGSTFLLFAWARGYVRGSVMVVKHLERHGSAARREATLKRLVRRWRPLLVSAGLVTAASAALLLAGGLA